MTRERKSTGAFTPAMFQILLVLTEHECHGYRIMYEVTEQTNGEVRLGPGTLYRSIKELLVEGMIAECRGRPDSTLSDDRRKYYQITAVGRQAARQEAERLARLVNVARAKQLLSGPKSVLVEGAE